MILIAIGANLPAIEGVSARETCERAANAVAQLPGLRLVRVSRWYESASVPPSRQPPYVNGVVRLDGNADPAALLQMLHALEAANGRIRTALNAARTLDLDIVAMGDTVRAAPDPVLPHPRMQQRAFVLQPLMDVAPEWVHPILGVTAERLLARLSPQDIHLLPLRGVRSRPK